MLIGAQFRVARLTDKGIFSLSSFIPSGFFHTKLRSGIAISFKFLMTLPKNVQNTLEIVVGFGRFRPFYVKRWHARPNSTFGGVN